MPLIVPDSVELEIINLRLNTPLTLRLYANDKTPNHLDTVAGYLEAIGGGYVAKPLVFANWTITAGEPTSALYIPTQEWIWTGPNDAPGSIYGYYVTRNTDGALQWAERFPVGNVPFAPIAGSKINVIVRFSVQSQF